MRLLVTVKAYPGLGHTEGETVCVAGVRLDTSTPAWVRLWPVTFRELPASLQFAKWQVIELDAQVSGKDRRPESYRPNLSTLVLGDKVDSRGNWCARRELLGPLLGETTLCALQRAQRGGAAPSLGLVKVRDGASARILDGQVWDPDKTLLAQAKAAPHLFRDQPLNPLQPPPLRVEYHWKCLDAGCSGHQQSSCDWEVGAAARSWSRSYPDVRPALLKKFGTDMLPPAKDTYFFVGNQHQRPGTFMVLGVFYPKPEPATVTQPLFRLG